MRWQTIADNPPWITLSNRIGRHEYIQRYVSGRLRVYMVRPFLDDIPEVNKRIQMATKSVNKVILIGHLGQDPELRYTGSGTPVCSLRIATNDNYKDSDGNLVERTEWHSVVAWARLAEICSEYLHKGSQIYIEGSLQTRQYEDRDGNQRYVTEVKAREMVMLGGRGSSGGSSGFGPGAGARSGSSGYGGSSQPATQPQASPNSGGSFEPDDDLPF